MIVGISEFQEPSRSLIRRLQDSVIGKSAYTDMLFALLHESLPNLRSNDTHHEAQIFHFDSHSHILLRISSNGNGTLG